jgi:divalent metal cation (Fe/Co/Zn/Cd) transporter
VDVAKVHAVLDRYRAGEPVEFRAPRTRESGRQRFVYIDVLVPGDWSVARGHDLAERVAADIAGELPGATTFASLVPRDDVTAGTVDAEAAGRH